MNNSEYHEIRVSSLPRFNDCHRRYMAQSQRALIMAAGYTLAVQKKGIASVIGTASHKGAQVLLEKKKFDEYLNLHDAYDASIAEYDAETDKAKDECGGIEMDPTTTRRDTAEKQIKNIVTRVHAHLIPIAKPELIEKELIAYYKIGKDKKIILTGHPDLVELGRIQDLKTGNIGSYHAQIGGYALLTKSKGYTDIVIGQIDYLKRLSLKAIKELQTPGPETQIYNLDFCIARARENIDDIAALIFEFERTKETRHIKMNPHSQLCSQQYCPAYGTDFCEFGG